MNKFFEDSAANQLSTDRVVTGYDPYLKTIYVTFESNSTSYQNTVGFSEERNRWISYYDFAPEFYSEDFGKMFSMYNGAVYSHDNATYCRFYGVDYTMEISLSFNEAPSDTKEYFGFQIQLSPNAFTWSGGDQVFLESITVTLTNARGQSTNLERGDFDVGDEVA